MKLADARSAWERVKADRRDGVTIPSAGSPRQARAVPTGRPYGEAVAEYVTGVAHEWRGGATGKYARLFAADAKATLPDGRVLGTLTWPELTDAVIETYVAKMSERGAKDTRVRLRSVRRYQETGKLPTRAAVVEHHDDMPYKQVPAFYQTLDMSNECARALAFTIQTGVRISDVLGTKEKAPATWAEIEGDVWNIPGDRTKNGVAHSIPLTAAALKLIGDRKDGRLFDVSYFQVYRFFEKVPYDIHGFRTSLRSWMMDTGFDREAAELVLQHKIGDETEQAYARGVILERRRGIMQKWSDFLTDN